MCDCKSAIRPDTGTTRAEVLYQAEYFPDTKHPRVSVDACIAHWVERLWMGGVRTRASCCGHDGLFGPRRCLSTARPTWRTPASFSTPICANGT